MKRQIGRRKGGRSRRSKVKAIDPFSSEKDREASNAHVAKTAQRRARQANAPPSREDMELDGLDAIPAEASGNGRVPSSPTTPNGGRRQALRGRREREAGADDSGGLAELEGFGSGPPAAKKPKTYSLKGIQKGETFYEFSKRLQKQTNEVVLEQQRATKPVRESRRAFFRAKAERAKRKSSKRARSEEDMDVMDMKPHERAASIRFGDHVRQPPKLTAPKAVLRSRPSGDTAETAASSRSSRPLPKSEHPLRQQAIDSYRRLRGTRHFFSPLPVGIPTSSAAATAAATTARSA